MPSWSQPFVVNRLKGMAAKVGQMQQVSALLQAMQKAGRGCGLCTLHCPMAIQVLQDHVQVGKPVIDDPECTRCGSCVDPCPRGSLRLGVQCRARDRHPRLSSLSP